MSKIKQLAEKYAQEAYSNPVDRNVGEADFIVGANAVLCILYDTAYKEDWITNPKEGIRRFFEVYKELKML